MLNQDRTLFSVESLRFAFEEVSYEVDSFSVFENECLWIQAQSGFGKSTLFQALLGFFPSSGRIFYGKNDWSSLPPHQRKFGMLFQDQHLLTEKTAVENIKLALQLNHESFTNREGEVLQALKELGLGSRMNAPVAELSGGERQRVAVIRALLPKRSVVLLDEPDRGLDEARVKEVHSWILNQLQIFPRPLLWASHEQAPPPIFQKRLIGRIDASHVHRFHLQSSIGELS